MPTELSKGSTATGQTSGEGFLGSLRSLLEIIRDYGMPTVAFGTGIYAFLLVLQTQGSLELKAGIALVLTLLGLIAQLWVYARHNPRTQSTEVADQLAGMTRLVELIVRSREQPRGDKEA